MMILPNDLITLVQASGEVKTVHLADYIAKQALILYFYPKDDTKGCTVQAVDFSLQVDEFAKLGYRVIGVSRDSVQSHQKFIAKHDLSIDLISDCDEKLCRYFDVIQPKQMYGKTHLGVVRSTFVFDDNQQLMHSLRNVKAKSHVEELMALLSSQT